MFEICVFGNSGYCQILHQVVVVNNCFTSLFGTNGLLSDIVIR